MSLIEDIKIRAKAYAAAGSDARLERHHLDGDD